MYIYLFETLLYLCFAFSAGYVLLKFIPTDSKPVVHIPFRLFQYAVLGIPLFSFASIVRTTIILLDFAPGMTFLEVLLIVLSDYSYGNAWILNLMFGTGLLMYTSFQSLEVRSTKWVAAGIWCCMILAHGWASHPTGFSKIGGLLSQSIHVGAVSIWLGTLIIVAWFTKGDWNWGRFVRWYTPLSISCMVLLVLAGLFMMSLIVDDYINSWGINYGEALLLKHLVFVPLVLLAFMNGFLTNLYSDGHNGRGLQTWLRLETILALIVLIITAFMGVQEPPHEDESENPTPSILFKLFHTDIQDLSLQWNWNLLSIACILMGAASLGLLFVSYKKNNQGVFIMLSCIGVIFPFLGLLLSVN
ncbi:MAG: copper resistance D family protein [Candidatus Pristimantibacillus sp.]